MTQRIPNGFTKSQWDAIIQDLKNHPSTINDYRKVLNRFHQYGGDTFSIFTLSQEDAMEYFAYLDQSDLSKNTIHRYKATLRSIANKMEHSPDAFPSYKNPFRKLIPNEVRHKTIYKDEMFASFQDIKQLHHIIDTLPLDQQILFEFMFDLGLFPRHIQNLKINDFKEENGSLILTYTDGTYIDANQTKYGQIVHQSQNGNITYADDVSFVFFDNYAEKLRQYCPEIGKSNSNAPFFQTVRKGEMSYRPLHHLLNQMNVSAGLAQTAITPNQLSYCGLIRSYIIHQELKKRTFLNQELQNTDDPIRQQAINALIEENEEIFIPIARMGWLGTWLDHYPIPRKKTIDRIINHLGEDALYKIVK